MLSRQFREIARSRVEALLASFPKLAQSGTQHTTVEQDNVRFVYQPLDELYIVLITNKQSNILQDIDSLHLFAQVTTSICRSLDEREILRNAFELLSAFDELVTQGYRENLSLSQIKTFLEMESHEERIQEIIERVRLDRERELLGRLTTRRTRNSRPAKSASGRPSNSKCSGRRPPEMLVASLLALLHILCTRHRPVRRYLRPTTPTRQRRRLLQSECPRTLSTSCSLLTAQASSDTRQGHAARQEVQNYRYVREGPWRAGPGGRRIVTSGDSPAIHPSSTRDSRKPVSRSRAGPCYHCRDHRCSTEPRWCLKLFRSEGGSAVAYLGSSLFSDQD